MLYRVILSIYFILFIASTAFSHGSNTYIKLAEQDMQKAEIMINSLGGKVNHIFPPNEIICYLPDPNKHLLEKKLPCEIEGLDSQPLEIDDKNGYTSWRYLKDCKLGKITPTKDISFMDIESFCGFESIDIPEKAYRCFAMSLEWLTESILPLDTMFVNTSTSLMHI